MRLFSRRSFLLTGCAAGTLASSAKAGPRHGIFAFNGFNGGKTQVNLNSPQTGGEFPFVNILKTGQNWANVTTPNKDALLDPSVALFNSDGYPTVVQAGGCYCVCFCPTQTERPGNYTMTWDGAGSVIVPGTIVSGNASTSGVVFTPGASGRMVVGIATTPVTNLKVYYVSDDPAQTFQTQFKDRLREANFGVIRFLNWQCPNGSHNEINQTTWAQRKPVTAYSFQAWEYRPAQYAGKTTKGAGDDYTVSAPSQWSGLVDKAFAVVQIDASATSVSATVTISIANPAVISWTGHPLSIGDPVGVSNSGGALPAPFFGGGNYYVIASGFGANSFQVSTTPGGAAVSTLGSTQSGTQTAIRQTTFNVGGTGVVPVKTAGGGSFVTGNNSQPIVGRYGAVTYDAVLGSWLLYGGNNGSGSTALENGVPPEICMQLCIEMGAHPYFVSPPLATDPVTDYHPSLMSYCASVQPSWMIPRYEGVNESWNGAFFGSQYFVNKGFAYWASLGPNAMQGKTICVIGQAANNAYGGGAGQSAKGVKYQVLTGVQTQTAGSGTTSSNERRDSTIYQAQSQAAQSPYVKDFAYNWITHVCCAQYMTPSAWNDGTLPALAAAYNGFSCTASLTAGSNVITVSGVASGTIGVGSPIKGPNLDTTVASLGTGIGGPGTYNLATPAVYAESGQTFVGVGSTSDATAPGAYVDTLNSGSGGGNLANLAIYYTNWFSFANARSLKLCGYEGGYAGTYLNGGTSQADLLMAAGKKVPALQTYLHANYQSFIDAGGEDPSCFQLGGAFPSNNVWSVLETVYTTTASTNPQWLEIIARNH